MIETLTQRCPDGAVAGARSSGSHGSALVFVHGVGSTAAIWDAQLAAFGEGYRAVAIELRGNGVPKPEPAPELITREGFACDVLTVADALGIERFTMVGCSLGGVVAFELWKAARHRIEAMVIVGSFARYPDAQAYADGIAAAVLAAGSMPAFAQARAAKLGLPPERMRETIEQMACKAVPSYLASTQATWTGDYREMLPAIDVPVLVCCGERDTVAPFALSSEIAAAIPGARLKEIPGAGHVANADAPDAFNAMLREFLTGAALVS
jgi:3-oxoadipate enol-lactonase